MSLRAERSNLPFGWQILVEKFTPGQLEIASSLENAPRNDICTVENNQFQGNQNVK
jgi:hypothetical protein